MASHVDVDCNGNSTGALEVSVTGGTAAYEYSLDNSTWQNNADFSGLGAGTHTVYVRDANGCLETLDIIITEPNPLLISEIMASHQDVSCNGGNNGSLTVQGSDGTGPYQYSINAGALQGSGTFSGLTQGTYTLLVQDANGCTQTMTITIAEPAPLTATIAPVVLDCNGICDGQATVTPGGGSGSYTYQWDNTGGSTAATTSADLCGDGTVYTVTVTDANDPACFIIVSVTPTQPDAIVVTTSSADANCSQADGAVDIVSVTGGSGTYVTYEWQDAALYPIAVNNPPSGVTGLVAGTYSVTVTDYNGCIGTATSTINNIAAGSVVVDLVVDVNCNGDSDGSIDITAIGTAPLDFDWSNDGTGDFDDVEDISGLPAGTYSVEVRDGVGCIVSTSATIAEPTAVTAVANLVQDVSCFGGSDGELTVIPGGGTVVGGYTYQWFTAAGVSTGQTTQSATGLSAGDYYVVVYDNSVPPCFINSDTVTIGEPLPIVATANVISNYNGEEVSCFGICDGQAEVTVTGGSGVYTYAWNNVAANATAITAADLCGDGTVYTVVVADLSNPSCSTSTSISLTEPALLVVTTTAIDAHCGQSDGVVDTLSVTGGTPAYTYNWENATNDQVSASPMIDTLVAGIYDLTVTDANGCTATSSVTVNDLPGPNDIAVVVDNDVSVLGACDGQATVSMTGAVSFDWYIDNSYTVPLGQNAATATGLCAQEYCVIATDANGCTDQACVMIIEPGAIGISSVLVHDSCYQECQGEIDITATGGIGAPYTYDWDNDGTGDIDDPEDLTGLCAGIYNVTVYDSNGAAGVHTVEITEPTLLTASAVVSSDYNGEDISCNGAFDGSIDLSVAEGTPSYTFSWTGPNGFTSVDEDPTGLEVGNYFVTASDAWGCEVLTNISLTEPTAVSVSAVSVEAHCGLADGSVDTLFVTGGVGSYTFAWSDDLGTGVGATASVTGLVAGTYHLSASDANGCTDSTGVVVVDIPAGTSTVVVDANVSCNGLCDGQATVSIALGGGSNTYQWSNGDDTQTADSLCAGTWYYVTATDVWGCEVVDSIQVTEPTPLTNSFINIDPILCYGSCNGFAQADPQGGTPPYNYQWDAPSLSNADTVGDLCSGWYRVTITDDNGCSIIDSLEFIDPLEIEITWTVVDANCNQNDGSIDITVNNVSGVPDFDWDNDGVGDNDDSEDLIDLVSSNYSVTVTDAKGCSQTATIPVDNIDGLTASISDSTMISCHGECTGTATIDVSGGLPPYSYNWDLAANNQTTATATNLCAGVYDVTVSDANGCTVPLSVEITEPDTLNVLLTGTDPLCNSGTDGSISTLVSGGTTPYSFAWDIPSTDQSPQDLGTGFYSLTVTDSLGCIYQDAITLSEPAFITLITGHVDPTCFAYSDGKAWVEASGGTPLTGMTYNYSWDANAGSQATDTAFGLGQGTYQVIVTDLNGCQDSIEVTLNEPTELVAQIGAYQNPLCHNSNDGFIVVDVSGATPGVSGYSFDWNTGQLTQTIQNLSGNINYVVTVEDAQGCTTTVNQYLTTPPELTVSLSSGDETCFGYSDGWVHSTVAGGTEPYDYNWSGLAFTADLDNVPGDLSGGYQTYTLIVEDDLGCTVTVTDSVNRPDLLSVIDIVTTQSHCGQADGSASVSIIGGTMQPNGFSYEWQNASSDTISNTLSADTLAAGTYYFTVTDGLGCQATQTISISDEGAPVVDDIVAVNVTCHGIPTGQATVTISGGVAPYTYQWDAGSGQGVSNTTDLTHTAYGLSGGTYGVVVTDAAGCIVSDNVTVFEPDTLLASISDSYDVQCHGDNTGWALVGHTGGVGPYDITWGAAASNQTTLMATGLEAGMYWVTVEDANGCTNPTSVLITEPTPMVVSIDVDEPLCYADTNGVISVYPQGGVEPYEYTWSMTTEDVSTVGSLSAGLYNLNIMDAQNCLIDSLIEVGQPNPILFDFLTIPETCENDNGQIVIDSIYGGTATYDVTISPNWHGFTATNVESIIIPSLTDGNYNVSIVDVNNCLYDELISVSAITPPTINLLMQGDVTCYGSTDGTAIVNTLNGSSPFTYTWDNGEEGYIADSLSNGTHSVSVVDADGCTDDMLIEIGQPDPVNIIANGPTGHVCINQATSLTVNATGGTPSYTFTWINPNLGTGQNVITYPQNDQTFHVFAVDANGCLSTDTASISISTFPLISLNLVDTLEICQYESTSATVFASGGNGGPYAYNWSNSTFEDAISVEPLTTTTYYVDVRDGCSTPVAEDSVTVIVHNAPVVESITATDGCEAHTADLQVEASSTDGSITYRWNFDDGNESLEMAFGDASHTYNYTGVYYPRVYLESENGCKNDTAVEVNVYPRPDAAIGANHTIVDILDAEIVFINLTEIESEEQMYWNWNFGDSLGSQDENPVHIYEKVGEYMVYLTATSKHGCIDTADIKIRVDDHFVIYFPNAFTPESGRGNNYFYPKGVGADTQGYRMTIYDRWGEPIFETTELPLGFNERYEVPGGWNGRYMNKGDVVQNGIYTWLVQIKDVNGINHEYSGTVTVIR
jgi:hypothetical protein